MRGPTEVPVGWYTFQLTPLSSSSSGTVSHEQLPTAAPAVENPGVSRTGPPAVPEGSMVPDSHIRRLGMVGPMTEQW